MPNSKTLPIISIIILNWNGKDDILECLESVMKIDYPNYSVVVVDNGSTDDSVQAIKTAFPDVVILETGKNLGFAEGNNVGIRYALRKGVEYILLLNNDTVVDPQILNASLEAANKYPRAGVFGAKVYYYSEPAMISFAGAKWSDNLMYFEHLGIKTIDRGVDFQEIAPSEYALGCALFFRSNIVDKIGFLEPKFFLIYEEADWCFRAKRAGYQCYVVPQAKVWHKISVSFGGKESPLHTYFMTRNRLLFAERNLPLKWRYAIYRDALRNILPGFSLGTEKARKHWLIKRIYWETLRILKEIVRRCQDPTSKAKFFGVRDYFLRRFGSGSTDIWKLNKTVQTHQD